MLANADAEVSDSPEPGGTVSTQPSPLTGVDRRALGVTQGG